MSVANERTATEATCLALSGHLRYGQVSIGEELTLGPCETRLSSEGSYPLDSQQAVGANPSPLCDSNRNGAPDPSRGTRFSAADIPKPLAPRQPDPADPEMEW